MGLVAGEGVFRTVTPDFFLPSFPIRTPLFTLLLTDGRWNVRGGRRERSVRENRAMQPGRQALFQIWFCLSAGRPGQGTDFLWASVTLYVFRTG